MAPSDQAEDTGSASAAGKESHHSGPLHQTRANQSGGKVVVFVEANDDLYITSTDRLIGKIPMPTKFIPSIQHGILDKPIGRIPLPRLSNRQHIVIPSSGNPGDD